MGLFDRARSFETDDGLDWTGFESVRDRSAMNPFWYLAQGSGSEMVERRDCRKRGNLLFGFVSGEHTALLFFSSRTHKHGASLPDVRSSPPKHSLRGLETQETLMPYSVSKKKESKRKTPAMTPSTVCGLHFFALLPSLFFFLTGSQPHIPFH